MLISKHNVIVVVTLLSFLQLHFRLIRNELQSFEDGSFIWDAGLHFSIIDCLASNIVLVRLFLLFFNHSR